MMIDTMMTAITTVTTITITTRAQTTVIGNNNHNDNKNIPILILAIATRIIQKNGHNKSNLYTSPGQRSSALLVILG